MVVHGSMKPCVCYIALKKSSLHCHVDQLTEMYTYCKVPPRSFSQICAKSNLLDITVNTTPTTPRPPPPTLLPPPPPATSRRPTPSKDQWTTIICTIIFVVLGLIFVVIKGWHICYLTKNGGGAAVVQQHGVVVADTTHGAVEQVGLADAAQVDDGGGTVVVQYADAIAVELGDTVDLVQFNIGDGAQGVGALILLFANSIAAALRYVTGNCPNLPE